MCHNTENSTNEYARVRLTEIIEQNVNWRARKFQNFRTYIFTLRISRTEKAMKQPSNIYFFGERVVSSRFQTKIFNDGIYIKGYS